MQFNVAFVLAAMASVAVAETVTVYACESSTSSGVASPTVVASTGVVTPPTPTGSPIFTGAASVNGVSAFGLVVAGGLALFI